jgi:hypothetical protein
VERVESEILLTAWRKLRRSSGRGTR